LALTDELLPNQTGCRSSVDLPTQLQRH
jgi:hypothetical protein